MQVLASKEKRPEDTGLERILVKKALAFWASRDDFLDKLFRSWGWFWGYDFVSHLAMGDSLKLREQSLLHQSWLNGSGNLNIGHSYVEWEQHRKNNPTLTNVFKPIPFFVFGSSGVGKSALLNAFCYHAQMRKGRSLTLGRELQAYHDRSSGEWRAGHMAPTSGYKSFNFWEDLNVTSFTVFDYGGKDTQPDQWEAQLQENIRSSRGLLFLVSAEDIGDSAALRGKSSWFEAILQYWMQCNPGMRHIPVGLVLTKADLVLRDQLPSLKRPYLVPDDIQRGLVEMYFPHRFIGQGEDLQTRAGRLESAIT